MALAVGSRLGPYEVLTPIGAGGMGEVYRARDTRLERTVAIKLLPQHLSSSSELRQRLELHDLRWIADSLFWPFSPRALNASSTRDGRSRAVPRQAGFDPGFSLQLSESLVKQAGLERAAESGGIRLAALDTGGGCQR